MQPMWSAPIPFDTAALTPLRGEAIELLRSETFRGDLDVVAVLLSELATNAILHALCPRSATITMGRDVVRVEVLDATAAEPVLRPSSLRRIGGNGMRLVDALALRWGVDALPFGEAVWFEVPRATSPST